MTKMLMKSWKKATLVAAIGLAPFGAAVAAPYDWVATGHVVDIEATYLPGFVTFTLDAQTNASSCTVQWSGQSFTGTSQYPQSDNVKDIYAMLLAAKTSGLPITVYGSNPTGGSTYCAGDYIHFNS